MSSTGSRQIFFKSVGLVCLDCTSQGCMMDRLKVTTEGIEIAGHGFKLFKILQEFMDIGGNSNAFDYPHEDASIYPSTSRVDPATVPNQHGGNGVVCTSRFAAPVYHKPPQKIYNRRRRVIKNAGKISHSLEMKSRKCVTMAFLSSEMCMMRRRIQLLKNRAFTLPKTFFEVDAPFMLSYETLGKLLSDYEKLMEEMKMQDATHFSDSYPHYASDKRVHKQRRTVGKWNASIKPLTELNLIIWDRDYSHDSRSFSKRDDEDYINHWLQEVEFYHFHADSHFSDTLEATEAWSCRQRLIEDDRVSDEPILLKKQFRRELGYLYELKSSLGRHLSEASSETLKNFGKRGKGAARKDEACRRRKLQPRVCSICQSSSDISLN